MQMSNAIDEPECVLPTYWQYSYGVQQQNWTCEHDIKLQSLNCSSNKWWPNVTQGKAKIGL